MPKPLKVEDLNRWYDEADAADRELFAEMRSNVLLIAGEHYAKSSQRYERVRQSPTLSESQKLRLTKNHMHKIARCYRAAILAHARGVTVVPQKDSELQDQKAAELNLSVWQDAKRKYRLAEQVRLWVADFVGIGEVGVKVFFDTGRGKLKGYEALVDEETGEPVVDEAGQPLPDKERPVFKGEFVFERLLAFNVLRQPGAKTMRGSPVCIRKLVERHEVEHYADTDEKKKFLDEKSEDDFIVFDAEKSAYSKSSKKILWREFYWPPSSEYPEGYYACATKQGILKEDVLPFGVWPIAWAGFDEHPTTARARSIIKVARPWQAELNRAASQQAMAQITLGDDKVIYQSGTKLAPGALLPGVRGITYQGMAPTVLSGRDGSQFQGYLESTEKELYRAVMLEELFEDQPTGALEPYTLLYRSMQTKAKFSEYGEKFEQFQIDVCEIYLELARHYLDDEEVIYAIGSKERVNIQEFRSTTPLSYLISIEAQDETTETQLGKQLTINHIMQYVGNKLEKEDIGKLIRSMPYGNMEESFGDFLIDYDNAKNVMLAMERGETPIFSEFDNHEYMAKRLVKRMREADFRYLPQEVQQLYAVAYGTHKQELEKQAAALAAAKNEAIPTGGAMIGTDMYIPDSADPTKNPRRARIPYEALDWLLKQLDQQGKSLDAMETMNKGMLAQMAEHLLGMAPQGTTSPIPAPASAAPGVR